MTVLNKLASTTQTELLFGGLVFRVTPIRIKQIGNITIRESWREKSI